MIWTEKRTVEIMNGDHWGRTLAMMNDIPLRDLGITKGPRP